MGHAVFSSVSPRTVPRPHFTERVGLGQKQNFFPGGTSHLSQETAQAPQGAGARGGGSGRGTGGH